MARLFFCGPSFVLRLPVRSKRVRRRIWAEFALSVVTWTLIFWAVAAFDLWKYFIWMYFMPAFVAANLQSWRKLHRTRWNDGRYRKRFDAKHRGEELAGTAGCFHPAARAVSWRSSSTGRSAPCRIAAARREIAADKAGRARALPKLSLRINGRDAVPGRSARWAAVADQLIGAIDRFVAPVYAGAMCDRPNKRIQ